MARIRIIGLLAICALLLGACSDDTTSVDSGIDSGVDQSVDSGAPGDGTPGDSAPGDSAPADGAPSDAPGPDAGKVTCDPDGANCASVPAPCGIGEVRAVVGGCWGQCVPVGQCSDVPEKPDCDIGQVTCEIVTPTCMPGYVPTQEGFCYGPCVPIGACACTTGGPAGQCPGDDFVCHNFAGRCGPYV